MLVSVDMRKHCLALSLCLFFSSCPPVRSFHISRPAMSRRLYAKKSDGPGGDRINKKKGSLPTKICVQCDRPMEWRKSWSKNWNEVKYCSDKCRKLSKNNKNVKSKEDTSSVKAIVAGLIATMAIMFPHASWADRAPIRPSTDELNHVFDAETWSSEDTYSNTFKAGDFRRLDETTDSRFYTEPRLVEHIDAKAVEALTAYHSSEFEKIGKMLYDDSRYPIRVLDICSSWVSHLPKWYSDIPLKSRYTVGIGMQAEELAQNKQLTRSLVQDLNLSPKLSLQDKSFDVVLCQLSIDYLTKPVEVIKEAARVLSDDGVLYISFSNRVFIEKAVGVWTGKSDLSHIETIGDYIHFSGSFDDSALQAIDLRKGANSGDPLYVVKAMKKHM